MSDSRSVPTIGAVVLLALMGPVGQSLATPQAVAREVVRETEQAVKLIQEKRVREAIAALDRAIAADDEYWQAHYQRGRALGLIEQWSESLGALLRAAELNPGHGHTHRLASIAAREVEEWETAWDQAIKAQLAGEDMTRSLLELYQLSSPPQDFETRINAAPVFVAEVEASDALAQVELPTNFNPKISTSRNGEPANLEDSSLNQSSLDLIRLQRRMRLALSESSGFAVVLQPGRAQYIMAISITDISNEEPRSASGYFRLIDIASRESVYRRNLSFTDISAVTIIQGQLRRYVNDLAAWMAER